MKKGQVQISFGMIFSILIIIATIAIAFYVIKVFLGEKNCIDAGLLYDGVDKKVEEAWRSSIMSDVLTLDAPSGVKAVCFGNLSASGGTTTTADAERREELRGSATNLNANANMYLYPSNSGCGGSYPFHNVNHMNINGFFCVDAVNGKITIKIKKEVFDPLVTLSR